MLLQDLNGKTVCVLGYGKEGKATVKALEEYAPESEITVADKNDELQIANCKVQLGESYLHDLDRFDVIIKSPGIPPSIFAICNLQSAILTNSTEIFLEEAAARGATVVGVTGSKGKSTTSTLIHEILKAGDKKSLLVGNIGEPAIEHVKDMDSNTARGEPQRTIFVLEMSSYQLMDCRSSPPIAVITTFFPEHLDYHASTGLSTGSTPLETYKGAKMNITRHQSEEDFVIFDGLSQGAKEIAMESAGKRIAA
ncbi:MAG: Mur ligase family protein, partial [Patescibacteria group bacterium]